MGHVRDASFSWSAVADLIRLRSQTGSFLLLFPTLWALVLAGEGHPPLSLTVIFVVGVFLMRSAGVTINDLWDRDLDGRVERTRERPLASGRLRPRVAVVVFGGLILFAAALVALLNPLTIWLALGALFLAIFYPLAKRVTPFPQAILGIAFGWGAIMAWAAVRNEVGWPAVGIFLATIFWAIGYDTIYALQDKEDDVRIGVRSTAIFFGPRTWLAILLALIAMVVLLTLVGVATDLAGPFYLALAGTSALFAHQVRQIKHGVSQARALALFKQHAWIGALTLCGFWAGVLFK